MIVFPLLAVCVDLTMATFINETASWSTISMFVRWICGRIRMVGIGGQLGCGIKIAALPCLDDVIFDTHRMVRLVSIHRIFGPPKQTQNALLS